MGGKTRSLLLAVALVGCDGYVGTEDEQLGESSRNQMSNGVANGLVNGIANGVANGLANGLANGVANSLSNGIANGIANGASNGLKNGIANGIANGVNTAGLSTYDAEQQTGKYADYLVQCALSPSQAIDFPSKGSVGAHRTYGVLGLATNWYTGVPDLNKQSAVSACMAARMNSRLSTMYFAAMGSGSPGTNWQAKTCDYGDGNKKLGEIMIYGSAWTNNIFTINPRIQFSTSSDLSTFTGPAQYNYGSTRICGNKACPSNITSSGVAQFTTSTSSTYMSSYPYWPVAFERCGGLSLYRHRPDDSNAGNVMTYVSCNTIYRVSSNTYCPPKCSYSECTSGQN